jgi:hypothetical protein
MSRRMPCSVLVIGWNAMLFVVLQHPPERTDTGIASRRGRLRKLPQPAQHA